MMMGQILETADRVFRFFSADRVLDPGSTARAKLFIWLCLVLAAVDLVIAGAFVFLPEPVYLEHQTLIYAIPLGGAAFCMVALFSFRITGSLVIAGNGLTALSLMQTILAVLGTGGFYSSLLPLICLMPLVPACVIGVRTTLVWFAVVVSIYFGFFYLDQSGFEFPGYPPEDEAARIRIITGMMIVSLVTTLLLVYEHINRELRQALEAERQQFAELAAKDPLTGLANRNTIWERLEVGISRASRNEKRLGLLYIDLDGFKEINDRCGHQAGDALLEEVAHRLRAWVRQSDTVGRVGGDEFVVILEDLDSAGGADTVARTLSNEVTGKLVLEGLPVWIEMSIGIAVYPDSGHDAKSLMELADASMYRAKRGQASFARGSVESEQP